MEYAHTFGDVDKLIGVYNDAIDPDKNFPCILFITAGLLHHIGPHRLHVEMSRNYAKQGVCSLRFDLSGVGDSEDSTAGGSISDRSMAELSLAMDFLQRQYGHQQFILIGLCSGADDAFNAADSDARVTGAVMLDGYAYQTKKYKLHMLWRYYWPRLFDTAMWHSKLLRLTGKAIEETETVDKEAQAIREELDDNYRVIPPAAEIEAKIISITKARKNLLFLYTGGVYDEYSYLGQLYDMFPSQRKNTRLQEAYFPDSDHTMVLRTHRDQVTAIVLDWLLAINWSALSEEETKEIP